MTDTTHGDSAHIRADNLRAKSDALLKRCGWLDGGDHGVWITPDGGEIDFDRRPHPYADAQQAIDLAEAMGLKITNIHLTDSGPWRCVLESSHQGYGPTIAEAICAAIEGAVE